MENEKIIKNINDRLSTIDTIMDKNILDSEIRNNILEELKDIKSFLNKMLKKVEK